MTAKLSADARAAALQELSHWSEVEDRDAIQRTFKFADFNAAFDFQLALAIGAGIARDNLANIGDLGAFAFEVIEVVGENPVENQDPFALASQNEEREAARAGGLHNSL